MRIPAPPMVPHTFVVVPMQLGPSFCGRCGASVNPGAIVCLTCGCAIGGASGGLVPGQKSKVAAGLFGIFFGAFGVHRFYLGHTNIGIVMLLAATLGGLVTFGLATVVVSIWGFIEGVMILAGSTNFQRDAAGVPLV